jgi:hypothetical protein
MRGESNSRAATSLVAQTLAEQFDDVEFGAGQRCPTTCVAFVFAAVRFGGNVQRLERVVAASADSAPTS